MLFYAPLLRVVVPVSARARHAPLASSVCCINHLAKLTYHLADKGFVFDDLPRTAM